LNLLVIAVRLLPRMKVPDNQRSCQSNVEQH